MRARARKHACMQTPSTGLRQPERALTASVDSCAEIKSAPSAANSCGRVWVKVPKARPAV